MPGVDRGGGCRARMDTGERAVGSREVEGRTEEANPRFRGGERRGSGTGPVGNGSPTWKPSWIQPQTDLGNHRAPPREEGMRGSVLEANEPSLAEQDALWSKLQSQISRVQILLPPY